MRDGQEKPLLNFGLIRLWQRVKPTVKVKYEEAFTVTEESGQLGGGDQTRTIREVDPSEPELWEVQDELALERLRSPNGDPYRAEHLREIGVVGLQRLYGRGLITADELGQLLAELAELLR